MTLMLEKQGERANLQNGLDGFEPRKSRRATERIQVEAADLNRSAAKVHEGSGFSSVSRKGAKTLREMLQRETWRLSV